MNRIVSGMLVMLMLSIMCVAGAEDVSETKEPGNEENPSSYCAVLVWNGKNYYLTEEEVARFKTNPESFDFYNNSCNEDSKIQPNAVRQYYSPSSTKKELDMSQAQYVSSCWAGGSSGCNIKISVSQSCSASFALGGSLSWANKNKIAATVSASATLSANSNQTQEGNYPVPANMYGRVRFTPFVWHTKGTFFYEQDQIGGEIIVKKTPVDAKLLIKAGNFADGLYELITRSYFFY